MKKRKTLLALLLMAVCLLTACQSTEAPPKASTTPIESATPQTETVTAEKPVKDRSGADITLPETIERIVSLAPSFTETLIDLGYQDKIVAVDTQTAAYGYEALSSDLPAFDMMAPDTEQLAALKPDILFVSGMTDIGGTDLYSGLKELGICVVCIPSSESIQGVKEDIAFIAACVGEAEKGEALIADMTKEIDEIAAIGSTITDKKTVYFEISAAPYCYSFGNGTFLNEMLELIGAKNILAEQDGWLPVEMESIVSANPDVILTNVNYIEAPVDELLSREGWGNVNAVKNNAVYYIDNQSSSLPNENIVKAMKEMAAAIYPDYYEK